MLPTLQKNFEAVKERKAQFLAIINEATSEQQQFKPTPDEWCMLEVSDHLLLAETGILKLIHKKGLQKATWSSKIGSKVSAFLFNIFLKLPVRVKAPISSVNPKGVREWAMIQSEWADSQQQWEAYLKGFPKDKLSDIAFKHPVAGQLNMAQTVRFLEEHIYHHLHQLKRIKANSAYPDKTS